MEATFCFIDLAGFTALTEAHGDHAAADLVARFAAMVDEALEGDATIVDMIGDAAFVVGETPDRTLACVERVVRRALVEREFPALRIGLHHGDAVRRAGRWYGTSVNLAARVAAEARSGQVLATASVAACAAARGIVARSLGRVALRNLLEPVELFLLELPALPRDRVIVDPVCRMRVFPESASGHLRFAERDYWFCSLECAARFASAPEAYVET